MQHVIFSLDIHPPYLMAHEQERLLRVFKEDKKSENVVALKGRYKGENEDSYICRMEDFVRLVKPLGFVDKQECFMYIGSEMKVCLLVFKNGMIESLGPLVQVCENMIGDKDYSYNTVSRKWFMLKRNIA